MNTPKETKNKARSEMGSKILPSSEVWLNFLAIQPSRKSVKARTAAKTAPVTGESSAIKTNGKRKIKRATVSTFGRVKTFDCIPSS